jgi:hypothetical protein
VGAVTRQLAGESARNHPLTDEDLNTVSANLRFEKQQERSAEEERMIEAVRSVIADNERLREKLVERGIIPPSDLPRMQWS